MYILRQAESIWGLRLSMLGPFAVFWRAIGKNHFEPVSTEAQAVSPNEAYVIHALSESGISLIDPATLTERIPLHRVNEEVSTSTLYQSLFGDYDALPWE